MVTFNEATWTLTDQKGAVHQVCPQVFWYLAPHVTVPDDTTRPLDLAMTLHNARIGRGVCMAMDDLLAGTQKRSLKTGQSKAAEELFEDIRLTEFPHRPSRLRSYFLSLREASALERKAQWPRWSSRRLVRCHMIRSQAAYHYADVRDFEHAARHGPTVELARSYWSDYAPERIPPDVTEVLADGTLYFPDWIDFPELDMEVIGRWHASYRRGLRR